MKKPITKKKLSLDSTTIRRLNNHELSNARGGAAARSFRLRAQTAAANVLVRNVRDLWIGTRRERSLADRPAARIRGQLEK